MIYYLVLLIAFLHLWFMVLEMFFWTKPRGMKIFGLKLDFALQSKALAMNQGLYNGFLAAALLYGALSKNLSFIIYGLICVTIAGIFGALTVNKRIFFIQALPAIITLVLGYSIFLNF